MKPYNFDEGFGGVVAKVRGRDRLQREGLDKLGPNQASALLGVASAGAVAHELALAHTGLAVAEAVRGVVAALVLAGVQHGGVEQGLALGRV